MRLFIALELPVLSGDWAEAYQAKLKAAVPLASVRPRWVPREELHLTLQFLGDVRDDHLPALSSIIKDTAPLWSPFRLSLGPLGTFGGPRGGALWVGVEQGAKTVGEIAAHLQGRLAGLGYKVESNT